MSLSSSMLSRPSFRRGLKPCHRLNWLEIVGLAGTISLFTTLAIADDEAPVDFTAQIGPILAERCLTCHNAGQAKGGLDLSTSKTAFAGGEQGASIVPGKPGESLLLGLLSPLSVGSRPEMPKKGEPLTDEQVQQVRRWIAEGAPWPEGVILREKTKADRSWWSLQSLSTAEPPVVDSPDVGKDWASWRSSPIDRFVIEALFAKGLSPSPRADARTLIRRASYDLLGLPPTPAEVEAYVADPRSDAYERLIDRLLSSPQYGEQWGRHWLDVVRFGESVGFERNVIIDNAWPFRDYVIRSFNEDKPFNRLILEHLAGDVVGKGDPAVEVGTAFLVAGPYDNVGNQDPVQAKQIRANTVDDMVTATGTAFLGLTINCCRCHDHKFDPLLQEDYYRLQSVFAGVYHGDRPLVTEADREQRRFRLQPLEQRRDELAKQKATLQEEAIRRAQADPSIANPPFKLPAADAHLTEDRFSPVEAKFVRLTILSTDRKPESPAGARIDEFEVWTAGDAPQNAAQAANGGRAEAASTVPGDFPDAYAAKNVNDGKYGASWIAAQDARLTITLDKTQTIDRVAFSSDRPRSYQGPGPTNVFVGEYYLEVSLDGRLWIKVADSLDRPPASEAHRLKRLLRQGLSADDQRRLSEIGQDLAEVETRIRAVPPLPMVWAGTFKQPETPTYLMQGGDPSKKGPDIHPASLSLLEHVAGRFELPLNADESRRRLEFATWVAGEANPLTARVLANRVWQHHFGTGIVDTPSDFGALGGQPTHPELLDWLARRVHELGWRLKPLHREILLSETYRQAGEYREDMARADRSARYLWRFPPRRLSAEEVRDTILFIAGKLNLKMGGPGFRLYQYLQDNVATYVPLDAHPPETYRRAVYHQNARASRVDLLADFDCPDNATSAPTRSATTTPLQALTLLNHRFTRDMAGFMAVRVEQETGQSSPSLQVRRVFELAFNRLPSAAEEQAGLRLIASHGLPALCRAIINANELIYLE